MNSFYKRGVAIFTVLALSMNFTPITTKAETKTAIEEETVYVGFIQDGKRSTLFNQDWSFFKGNPVGAEKSDFDDSSWRSLDLPHDWSIEGEFTVAGEAESGFLLGGTGWYRKHVVVPEKYEGKAFTLNFDGVYMNSEVYVNGKKLGEHNYGYTAFAFDITDELIFDGETENVIAVKVSNPVPTSRWYSGSGIYRDVTLTVTNQIHVAHLGSTVTTPNLEEQQAGAVDTVIETIVENNTEKSSDVTVKTTVLNSEGEAVSIPVQEVKSIVSNSSQTFKQVAIVNKPSLWSTENPNVYKAKTEVIVDGEVVDTYFTDFGYRYYSFDRDTGFSLNGENVKLKGVCMHHDQGSLGAASYYRAVERQMEIMKEMGVNAIRVSHNPASQTLLDICNRLGLMIINEAFDTWTNSKNGNSNDFAKFFNTKIGAENQIINGAKDMTWGEFEARTMVKNSKNAPSVIMWSVGNEVLEGIGGDASNYPTVVQNIIDWFKDEDATRPITIGDNRSKGGQQLALSISNVVAKNGGVVGFNYTNIDQFNSLLNSNTDWIAYDSETSSAVHSRGHYKTIGRDNTNLQMAEYDNNDNRVGWGASASNAWKWVIKNDRNAGEFVWTGFDYIGEPTPWNGVGTGSVSGQGAAPKSSYFGIVDTAGFEKDIYYLYQSQWNDDVNTLHVLPTWNKEDIYLNNGNATVQVFTDAYKVELYLNGNKIGESTSSEHTTVAGYKYYTFDNDALYPTFNVPYQAGTLEAKAFDKNGNEITNTQGRKSVTTYGTATTVKLSADNTNIGANGYDISYITVDLVDENGNFVGSAANNLTYKLEGNGKIVGLDNGDATDVTSYKPTSDKLGNRRAYNGKALVIVQSTKDAGEMTLTVSGEGIESKSIIITTENKSGDDKYLASYDIVKEYYVGLGEKPQLPESVIGKYSDGTTAKFNIVWNEYEEEVLNNPQIFKVTGKLEGTDVAVIVNVHVIGEVVAMENYSTFTYAGTVPSLPNTVKGYLANANESENFVVNWDLEGKDFTKANSIVNVNGVVELLGKEYNVIASVRVTEPLKTATNLAIDNSSNKDIPSLSQSCTTISDNLKSIINGVTNNGTATSERWTNWNERNLAVNGDAKGAYIQLDWKNKHSIDRLDLWHFTDGAYSRIPKKVEISYKNDVGEYVVVTHTNTTEVSYTSGETTYRLDNVINTDSIRIYMQQPEVGKCVGLTEVAVYEHVPQITANTNNNLSEIKLDGSILEGFSGDINDYTINTDKIPTNVEANALDNAAITILPVYNNKTKIIVLSEAGIRNIYIVNYEIKANTIDTDINRDGITNIADVALVSKYYGTVITDNDLSVRADVNRDGVIDKKDIQLVIEEVFNN